MTDITRNYHGGHPRSEEANAQTDKHRDTMRILKVLHDRRHGMTCDEMEIELGMLHQTCSARFSDMKRMGWIVKCGERPTRTGCKADVWRTILRRGAIDA